MERRRRWLASWWTMTTRRDFAAPVLDRLLTRIIKGNYIPNYPEHGSTVDQMAAMAKSMDGKRLPYAKLISDVP